MTLDQMESQLIDVMGGVAELNRLPSAMAYQSVTYYTGTATNSLRSALMAIRMLRAQMEKNAEAEGQLEALSGMQKAANVY